MSCPASGSPAASGAVVVVAPPSGAVVLVGAVVVVVSSWRGRGTACSPSVTPPVSGAGTAAAPSSSPSAGVGASVVAAGSAGAVVAAGSAGAVVAVGSAGAVVAVGSTGAVVAAASTAADAAAHGSSPAAASVSKGRPSSEHGPELELGGAAHERLGLGPVADAGEVDDDAVALAGDLRLGHAQAVDAGPDDLDGLVDVLAGRVALGGEDDRVAALEVEAQLRAAVGDQHGRDRRDGQGDAHRQGAEPPVPEAGHAARLLEDPRRRHQGRADEEGQTGPDPEVGPEGAGRDGGDHQHVEDDEPGQGGVERGEPTATGPGAC